MSAMKKQKQQKLEVAAATVESSPGKASKRKRLAKAFPLPLEKERKKRQVLVRERFTLLPEEGEVLARIKRQFAEQGVTVKKSQLVRAGLALLATRSEEELKALLATLPEPE